MFVTQYCTWMEWQQVPGTVCEFPAPANPIFSSVGPLEAPDAACWLSVGLPSGTLQANDHPASSSIMMRSEADSDYVQLPNYTATAMEHTAVS
ncbi:hypothetical protein RJ55_01687 [Drechmeria coniospora]|nr:hypothetical protein RJ55_01687 [Drechmeria coniospora]